nr:MAG: major capsid protein [Army ant associated bidensovirus 5]
MKRANEDSGGGDAKKSAGSGGMLKGMPGGADQKVDPIPRPLHMQTITLNFTQRTWEEIGAGELKYLPLCQTVYYMMDEAMLGQLNKFKGLCTTMQIHQPKARISNLLMLQDDLINQGGTPLETTAFTQACYMIKYSPSRQINYFQLANIDNCKTGAHTPLLYDLSDVVCGEDYKQLISLSHYEDFEKLAILPAKVDKYAGYSPHEEVKFTKTGDINQMDNVYISPFPKTSYAASEYSANMQPTVVPVVPPLKQITWAKNLDKISFHKYGDTIEIPITTNMEGVPLLPDPKNDFTTRTTQFLTSPTGEVDLLTVGTELIWPGQNRPYNNRKDNLAEYTTYDATKGWSPLSHCFFTMPPIRKANGALLKQRVSFLLEQSFSITINTTESIWGEDVGQEFVLSQNNGVIIRPHLYGKLKEKKADPENAICPTKTSVKCDGSKCYLDTFASLIDIFVDKKFDLGTVSDQKLQGAVVDLQIDGTFDNTGFTHKVFKEAWQKFLVTETNIAFQLENTNGSYGFDINLVDHAGGKWQQRYIGPQNKYFQVLKSTWKNVLEAYKITCVPNPARTPYNYIDRQSSIFFV